MLQYVRKYTVQPSVAQLRLPHSVALSPIPKMGAPPGPSRMGSNRVGTADPVKCAVAYRRGATLQWGWKDKVIPIIDGTKGVGAAAL